MDIQYNKTLLYFFLKGGAKHYTVDLRGKRTPAPKKVASKFNLENLLDVDWEKSHICTSTRSEWGGTFFPDTSVDTIEGVIVFNNGNKYIMEVDIDFSDICSTLANTMGEDIDELLKKV